jgi:hypothetical protein
MATLIPLWSSLLPDTLTPTQVDNDLRRHGLDVRAVRELINTLSQDLSPEFAAGVLAGIRFALARPLETRPESASAKRRHDRVIPFPAGGRRGTTQAPAAAS